MEKTLLVIGDSWTWGSELKDLSLPSEVSEFNPVNTQYRDTHIWPWYLNQKLQFNKLVNLAIPACSNDSIQRNLLWWLSETGRLNNNNDDLFVVIGFTSPERKDFYVVDERIGVDDWRTFWPARPMKYFSEEANTFGELYRNYFSSVQESTYRYLNTILYLQMILKQCNINYLMFQGFYDHGKLTVKTWKDNFFLDKIFNRRNSIREEINQMSQLSSFNKKMTISYDNLWNMIDDVRFVNKNSEPKSCCNYLLQLPNSDTMFKISHPSEKGHEMWAEYLYKYIQEKSILGASDDNN